jgi:hypothetical protein
LVAEGLSDCDSKVERAVKIFEAAINVTKDVVPRPQENSYVEADATKSALA